MQLFVLGTNHTSAPVAIREQIAFRQETLGQALRMLGSASHSGALVSEAAVLSTCNRTEIYCVAKDPRSVMNWLAGYHGVAVDTLSPYLYCLSEQDAARQAFRVAAGLDSMVLGEPQILGQMKHAMKIAEQAGTLGTLLQRLLQQAFAAAKEVRSSTAIGACSVSMAAATVKLAQRTFGDLRALHVLFIGAGEMVALCAEHFAAQHPASLTIANRTASRAVALAKKVGGASLPLSALPARLGDFDIIVTSTASQLPIVNLDMLRDIHTTRSQPLLVIDLAVPRDIEPAAAGLDQVRLYTVDDLSGMVQQSMSCRQQAVTEAELLIDAHVGHFMQWRKTRAAVPTIQALRAQANEMRCNALAKAQRQLSRGADPLSVLESLSNALTNKLIHGPSHALHRRRDRDQAQFEALLRELYRI